MAESFFEKPILNSPYEYPARHWYLDDDGQPTNEILDKRRPASYVTPVPKPKKTKKKAVDAQQEIDIGQDEQRYKTIQIISMSYATTSMSGATRSVAERRRLASLSCPVDVQRGQIAC